MVTKIFIFSVHSKRRYEKEIKIVHDFYSNCWKLRLGEILML